MKLNYLWILGLLALLVMGCTVLDKKCDKLATGTCWQDENACPRPPMPDVNRCKDNWSCGYYHNFQDP